MKLVLILQRSAHDNRAGIRLLVSKKGTPLEHGACYLCECHFFGSDYTLHSSIIKGTTIFRMIKVVILRNEISRSLITDALAYYERFAEVLRYLQHGF